MNDTFVVSPVRLMSLKCPRSAAMNSPSASGDQLVPFADTSIWKAPALELSPNTDGAVGSMTTWLMSIACGSVIVTCFGVFAVAWPLLPRSENDTHEVASDWSVSAFQLKPRPKFGPVWSDTVAPPESATQSRSSSPSRFTWPSTSTDWTTESYPGAEMTTFGYVPCGIGPIA